MYPGIYMPLCHITLVYYLSAKVLLYEAYNLVADLHFCQDQNRILDKGLRGSTEDQIVDL